MVYFMATSSDNNTYTEFGLYKKCKADGMTIARETIRQVMLGIEPDGNQGSNKTYTWGTFTEAREAYQEAKAETQTAMRGFSKPENVDGDILEQTRRNKRLDADKKEFLLRQLQNEYIHRDEVLEYLLVHQNDVNNILRLSLLNTVPSELRDPKARQACLELYNKCVDSIQDAVWKWMKTKYGEKKS
jgi:hypothetical protein